MGQSLCCIQVKQSTVAIREHFGKFDDVLEPGCYCIPWFLGYRLAGSLSLRVEQLDVHCETKTKDNVFVTVVASVQYRASAEKAVDAYYKLSNTKAQIQSHVFDAIRTSVPKLNLDAAFEQKNDIAKAVKEGLEKAISGYGFEIVQTLIVNIKPDAKVMKAMNEINAATQRAEANKILQIKWAEGLRDSVLAFTGNVPDTNAKDVMDMVLMTQYIDSMKEIVASSKSSFCSIQTSPGEVTKIASQSRNDKRYQGAHASIYI